MSVKEYWLANPANKSEKVEIDYMGNFAIIIVCILLFFVAIVDFNSLTASSIALTISIIFVGHQIDRVTGKLR